MVKEFEDYALAHYLPAVNEGGPDPAILVAGLRFIATRGIEGHEARLREIFTTRYPGKLNREIAEACLEALLATTKDAAATAQFLALVATRDLPASPVCDRGLQELGPVAYQALLTELTQSHQGFRLRKLARLLGRLSKVPSPKPIPFWEQANVDERCAAASEWEAALRQAGGW